MKRQILKGIEIIVGMIGIIFIISALVLLVIQNKDFGQASFLFLFFGVSFCFIAAGLSDEYDAKYKD